VIDDVDVRVISAPYFVATKLLAFEGRGNRDFQASHDLEDVLGIVDGRATLEVELGAASDDVRRFVATQVGALLQSTAFLTAIAGHLPGDSGAQARAPTVIETLRRLAALAP
jgi:hypothetical protein